MSIRIKVFLVTGGVFLALLASVFLISTTVLTDSYLRLERAEAGSNLQRAYNIITDELDLLRANVGDWSIWDDTYEFMQGTNEDYIADNLTFTTLQNLDLDAMFFLDNADQFIYGVLTDSAAKIVVPPVQNEVDEVLAQTALNQLPDIESQVSGFTRIADQLVMVASRPIVHSDGSGPIVGSIIFGRTFNAQKVGDLANTLQYEVTLFPFDSANIADAPADLAQVRPELMSAGSQMTRPLDDNTLVGYVRLDDLDGQPTAILRALLPRGIYAQGQETLSLFRLLTAAVGLIIAAVTYLTLDRLVLSRVARLSSEVAAVQAEVDSRQEVTVASNDEVTSLAQTINAMLARLRRTQDQQLAAKNHALMIAIERERETSAQLKQTISDLEISNQRAHEATRLKSEFLATMSHELRTPLNAILGFTGILVQGIRGSTDGEAKRMLGRVQANGERLLGLINQVLDLAKIESGRVEMVSKPFVLHALVEQWRTQMSALIKTSDVSLDVTIDDLPEQLVGDAERLTQIAVNLLGNAIKFTERGSVHLHLARAGEQWSLVVTDTGIGIPPHALDYIFEEFRQLDGSSQRAYGGSGLGLAITRNLVRMMHGTITVQSELGKGSTFTVTLPLNVPIESLVVQPVPAPPMTETA